MTPIAEQAGRYIDAGDINSALDAIQEAEASGESCGGSALPAWSHLRVSAGLGSRLSTPKGIRARPSEHIDGAAKFADMCFMTERFAEALPHYHKVVARYPDMVQMWKNLSACYSKLEQFREALSCMLKVQALEAGAHLNESSVLRQRDWLLNTQNALSRLGPQRIERRHKLSGDEFRNGYYSASKPVIITGRLDNWPALKLWSLQYFKDRFGDQEVEVQANRASDPLFGGFDPSLKRKMLCADVMDEMAKPSSDLYMVGTNAEANSSILRQISGDVRNVDEYLLDGDDFWSLWLGPAGTFTSAAL